MGDLATRDYFSREFRLACVTRGVVRRLEHAELFYNGHVGCGDSPRLLVAGCIATPGGELVPLQHGFVAA